MKNKLYIIGILSISLLIVGGLFKVQHWAGASIILFSSIAMLNLVFFPLALISNYNAKGNKKGLLYLASFITLICIFSAALFKIMHWPGASMLIFVGMLLPVIFFLPVYLVFYRREKEESLTNFLYITFFLVGLSAMSGFLAIDVSKNILRDMIRISEISDLSEYDQIKKRIADNESYTVRNINSKTDSLLAMISEIKRELVLITDESNQVAITKQGEVNNWKLKNTYGKDATVEILLNREKGHELEEQINDLYNDLTSVPEIHDSGKLVYIANLPYLIVKDNNKLSERGWLINNMHGPLALALMRLTQIENAVRLAKLEAQSLVSDGTEL